MFIRCVWILICYYEIGDERMSDNNRSGQARIEWYLNLCVIWFSHSWKAKNQWPLLIYIFGIYRDEIKNEYTRYSVCSRSWIPNYEHLKNICDAQRNNLAITNHFGYFYHSCLWLPVDKYQYDIWHFSLFTDVISFISSKKKISWCFSREKYKWEIKKYNS